MFKQPTGLKYPHFLDYRGGYINSWKVYLTKFRDIFKILTEESCKIMTSKNLPHIYDRP